MKKSSFATIKINKSLFLTALYCVAVGFNLNAQCPSLTATPSSISICSDNVPPIILKSNQSGTTYSWEVLQKDVAGANEGSGLTINQTLSATGNVQGSVLYTVTPEANGCKGASVLVTVIVNPVPLVIATPLTSTLTSGNSSSIILNSEIPETTYSWTVIQSGVIGAKKGSGSVIRHRLTTEAEKGIVTYRVTPAINGCVGESIRAKVIVKR